MDLTVVATPGYFGTMGLEYEVLKRRAARDGPSAADYERRDTIASLSMGVGSLLAPFVLPRLLRPVTPGRGRYAKVLVVSVASAAAITTVADWVGRMDAAGSEPAHGAPADAAAGIPARDGGRTARARRRRLAAAARKVASVTGVATMVGGGVAVASALASRTTTERLFERRIVPDLGKGPVAVAAAMVGWDFIYYWNHRFMHTARYMWAIHVVHHSSERYNLSTALRQPVADALGTFVPYGSMALFGVQPELIATARGVNLLYQYWIHTDTVRSLGPLEEVLNSPSHHRVHHGSNQKYLDRNHGGILIVWDRLFGTFQREEEPVVYGLTKNIDTFNPLRIATHEHLDIIRDVARSRTWRERFSFVFRGPGWAYRRHAEREAAEAGRLGEPEPSGAAVPAA